MGKMSQAFQLRVKTVRNDDVQPLRLHTSVAAVFATAKVRQLVHVLNLCSSCKTSNETLNKRSQTKIVFDAAQAHCA